MADDFYTVNAQGRVAAGRFIRSAAQRKVDAMPSNSWLKLNENNVSDVWTPLELRAPYLSGKSPMRSIINAWSSFAWDKNRSRMVLWGGGHANTSANDVYTFNANTGLWELAFYPSDYYTISSGLHSPICGGHRQPNSAHTYDNQIYCPIIDKFVTFGGAVHGTGASWDLFDGDGSATKLRNVLCYSLDMTLAGQGYVGGGTGDNPIYDGPDLQGANAWTVRDWLSLPTPPVIQSSSINCGTAYREENGKDVLYKTMGGPKELYRIELNANWQDDSITKVGRYWGGAGGSAAAALDSNNDVFIMFNNLAGLPFSLWDLKTSGPTNNNKTLNEADITGDIADFMATDERIYGGIQFNPLDGKFYIWLTGGLVYTLTAPAGNPTPLTGWHMEKITPNGVNAPSQLVELEGTSEHYTGVSGKWKWAPELGAFIALHKSVSGEVWAYKP